MKNEGRKKAGTLHAMIFNDLKREIYDGVWQPGAKLPSERELCNRFGVSKITVRSALQQLEAIDLIRTYQGRGSIVLEPGNKEIVLSPSLIESEVIPVLEYRMVIEKGMIRLTCQRITDEGIAELEENYAEMMEHVNDLARFAIDDCRFHTIIAKYSMNPILIEADQVIQEKLRHSMDMIVSMLGCGMGLKYHKEIINALKSRNKEECERIMGEHLDSTIDGVKLYYLADN